MEYPFFSHPSNQTTATSSSVRIPIEFNTFDANERGRGLGLVGHITVPSGVDVNVNAPDYLDALTGNSFEDAFIMLGRTMML